MLLLLPCFLLLLPCFLLLLRLLLVLSLLLLSRLFFFFLSFLFFLSVQVRTLVVARFVRILECDRLATKQVVSLWVMALVEEGYWGQCRVNWPVRKKDNKYKE